MFLHGFILLSVLECKLGQNRVLSGILGKTINDIKTIV